MLHLLIKAGEYVVELASVSALVQQSVKDDKNLGEGSSMFTLTDSQTRAVAGGGTDYCVYDDQNYSPGAIIKVSNDVYLQCVEVPSMWNILGIEYYAWASYQLNAGC